MAREICVNFQQFFLNDSESRNYLTIAGGTLLFCRSSRMSSTDAFIQIQMRHNLMINMGRMNKVSNLIFQLTDWRTDWRCRCAAGVVRRNFCIDKRTGLKWPSGMWRGAPCLSGKTGNGSCVVA